jgi:two-component system, NarL family, sensor histidine kinase UhpB
MRAAWVGSDGSCAALSPPQFRAVLFSVVSITFLVDVTTNLPIAATYFTVIAATVWSHDRWMPAAVSGVCAGLLPMATLFTDKGLPEVWLMPPRAASAVVMLGAGWLITKHRGLVTASLQRELMLRTIFDSEPACVKLLGPDNTLIEMNRGGLTMIEADRLDIVKGHDVLPLVTAPHREAFAQLTKDVFDGKSGSVQFEIVGLRGTHRWLETHGAPLRDEMGRITAMLAVSHDITLRRQAEALLLDSEQRLHQAASIAGLGFFDYDRRTNRVYWSDGTREILGMPRDATPGLAEALEWTHPDDRDRCIAAIAQAKDPRGDGNVTIECRIVRADGEARRVSIRSQTQFEDTPDGRQPVRTLGTVFDVTERHRAAEQRDALALRVLQVQEDERRAVARDLHDEIGQALSALKLNLLSLRRNAGDPARVVGDSLQIADEVLQQVRDIALSLRPVALDDLGLGAAVQWYVEQTAARTGLDLSSTIDPELPAASPVTEIACFRVLQEALTNVHRHSRATRAHVRLSWDGTGLELVVKDDGIGFSPAGVPHQGKTQADHMGLIGIRERASLLRGEATVTSQPGAGCEVRVRFPVAVDADRTAAVGV